MQGNGIYEFMDGTYYAGEWKQDQYNGYGGEYFPNGNQYIGYFKNGMYHGKG